MEETKHFLGCLYEACVTVCVVNSSANALISRAGCNLNNERFHDPIWGSTSSENLMKLVFPDLHVEYHKSCLLLKSDITRAENISRV